MNDVERIQFKLELLKILSNYDYCNSDTVDKLINSLYEDLRVRGDE